MAERFGLGLWHKGMRYGRREPRGVDVTPEELSAAVDEVGRALERGAPGLSARQLLDGLDLPACYLYQEWCMAERETASRLRLAVLTALVERLQDQVASLKEQEESR